MKFRFTYCHRLMVFARICEIFPFCIRHIDENCLFELCILLLPFSAAGDWDLTDGAPMQVRFSSEQDENRDFA